MQPQPAPALPAMEYAERSDPGRDPDKQVNEDVCVHRETRFGHLCVVCDGMGGHAAGREAAELAIALIGETFERATEVAPPHRVMLAAIEAANRGVYAMQTSEVGAGRPGCTVVAALMHAHGTEIAHVGDSRAYLVHEGQIFRLTRDHSIVQELVDRGLLTPQQATHHPDANRITRALGIAPEVEADIRATPIHHVAGDALVLCSDGLSDLVEEHEILAIVGGQPAAQSVGQLIDLANARGGHDNITAVVLRARETALAPQMPIAPTVVPTLPQTSVPPSAPAASPRTFVGVPVSARVTEVPALSSRPLEPTPPPATHPDASEGTRRSTAILAFGLLIALIAVAFLGAVLALHVVERNGKRNVSSEPPLAVAPADAMPSRAEPTTLTPETVVLPTASTPLGEPLAPLEPGPTEHKRKKR